MADRKKLDQLRRANKVALGVRATSDRVMDRQALVPVRRSFFKVTQGWLAKMGHFATHYEKPLEWLHVSHAVAAIRGTAKKLAQVLGSALTRSTGETLIEGFDATAKAAHVLSGGMAVLDGTRGERLVLAREAHINELRRRASAELAAEVTESAAAKVLLSASQLEGARLSDLFDRMEEIPDEELWRVDRLVRTETSWAFNLAQREGISMLAQMPGFEDVMLRWTELVDDSTGKPYDDRVADDSLALHGQVVRPGGRFVIPPGARGDISEKLLFKSWEAPPNRPNDRAVLVPWMKQWGVPAWMMLAGVKIRL